MKKIANQKKVLFIAFNFPPCKSTGASIRSEKLVKYLTRKGWEPTVLAYRERSQEELYENVVRVSSLTPFSWPYEVTPYGWSINIPKYAEKLLAAGDYKMIYVTAPPYPQIATAVRLKKRHGVPLTLDFRDAWSLDPYVEGSLLKKMLYRYVFPSIEKRLLAEADLVLLNCPTALAEYRRYYPELAERFVMLPNGFDEEDFSETKMYVKGEKIRFLYCGRFGIGSRDPFLLLQAVQLAVEAGIPIEFKILGDSSQRLEILREKMGLADCVVLEGPQPHKTAITAMMETDVLVLYQEKSDRTVTPVAGKTYEYIRSGKPILAVAPNGDNTQLIEEYAGNCQIVNDFSAEGVLASIKVFYQQWINGELQKNCGRREEYLARFNRESQTNELIRHWENLMSRKYSD